MQRGMKDSAALLDEAVAIARRSRVESDELAVVGYGFYELFDDKGKQKQAGIFVNTITTNGDEVYARRGASVATVPNAPTGMRLGTGTTAVSKSGAGSAIVTYISGSALAFDGGFPTFALIGSDTGGRVTFKRTWAPGVATNAAIAEAVITNETGPTDVAGNAANTVSRALLSPVVNKAAGDTLEVTWTHDWFDAP